MGLAIVQEIVHRHQGAIAVQSQLAAGTTFTVTLPRTLGEESQVALLLATTPTFNSDVT